MEVLIAMSIIAIALTAVYRLHSQTLSMAHTASFHTTAPLLAHQKMVELQIMPAEDLADDQGDFGEGHPGFSWRAMISEVESESLDQTEEDLKRIDVTVYFGTDQLSFSLRRYLFTRT